MATVRFAAAPAPHSSQWPEALAALLFVAGAIAILFTRIHFDITWQMWSAKQMLNGARFYVDVVEVNPPLWFWMALPVEWLVQRFGLPTAPAILAANLIYFAAGLALFAAYIRDLPETRRAVLLLAALVALFIVPLKDFAQREHLALAATLPYAALIATRRMGEPVSWRLALATGVYAAFAFALKHYFAAVPLVLEIWLLMALRRGWRPIRPETVALAALAVAYAAAIVWITPEYLREIVPQLRLGYAPGSITDMFRERIFQINIAMWAIGLGVLWLSRHEFGTLATALTIAALVHMAAYLIQMRGWSYHAITANGTLLVALFALLPGPRWRALALAAAVLPQIGLAAARGPVRDKFAPPIAEATQGLPAGSSVMGFTVHAERDWPAVLSLGWRWPARYYDFWMVPALDAYAAAHGGLDAPRQAFADEVRAETLSDLTCNQPQAVLVDSESQPSAFDFMMQSPAFAAFMKDYQAAPDVAGWHVYKRAATAPAAPACHPFQ